MRSPQAGPDRPRCACGCRPWGSCTLPLPSAHPRLWTLPGLSCRVIRQNHSCCSSVSFFQWPRFPWFCLHGSPPQTFSRRKAQSLCSEWGGFSAACTRVCVCVCVCVQNCIFPRAREMPGMAFNNWKTVSFPRSLLAGWPPGSLAAEDRVLSWSRSGCLEADLSVSGQLPEKSTQNLPLELVAGLLPRPGAPLPQPSPAR